MSPDELKQQLRERYIVAALTGLLASGAMQRDSGDIDIAEAANLSVRLGNATLEADIADREGR